MTVPSDSSSSASSGNWLFKNKEHGKTSAAASLVCVFLWSHFYWFRSCEFRFTKLVYCVRV